MITLPIIGSFPRTRLRRNRTDRWMRTLASEHALQASDLVWPVFVQEGKNLRTPVESLPDVYRLSVDLLVEEVKKAADLGIPAIALFPVIDASLKDEQGSEALNPHNLLSRAIHAIKGAQIDIGVICDVALDPYTSHGHDGVIKEGTVDNDETLALLAKQALVQAQAGADIVAPSDMMDGRVGVIRDLLDNEGQKDVKILSYAAKYASSFYGPFRDAVGSAGSLGNADKRSYQMDPSNAKEAIAEVLLDVREGADMVMVKPGMPYLDVISNISSHVTVPVFAYQVSGEYAMIKAAALKGWLEEEKVMIESLLAFKRAGARAVFTYAACDIATYLNR